MAVRAPVPELPDDEQLPLAPAKESPSLVKQRRLLNRWSIFALVFVSAVSTVLYVIAVKKLLVETEDLNRKIDSLRTVNESLRTETYRLQSSERITRVATERLGLIPPPKAPTVLEGSETP
jgi:cell division protein FtsL